MNLLATLGRHTETLCVWHNNKWFRQFKVKIKSPPGPCGTVAFNSGGVIDWLSVSFYNIRFVCVQSLSCVRLFAALWTVTHQAPLPMGFPRQAHWSGLSFPPPRDLPDPGTEPASPALQVDSLPPEPPGKPKNIHAEPLIISMMGFGG